MARVIAIDGPAGAGKSTLARALAARVGLAYLNTGAMYRAVTAAALRNGIAVDDAAALADVARGLRFSLDRGHPPSLAIEGLPHGADLTSSEVEATVSQVAAHPSVREVLRAEQRGLGASGAVVEGRDIGTVVFPDAEVKIFLLASAEERAARRQAERGQDTLALAEALDRRDARDSKTNPLVPAPDAHTVDTTGRPVDEVLGEILVLVGDEGLPRE
jgi:CMP/dCMP kinase